MQTQRSPRSAEIAKKRLKCDKRKTQSRESRTALKEKVEFQIHSATITFLGIQRRNLFRMSLETWRVVEHKREHVSRRFGRAERIGPLES